MTRGLHPHTRQQRAGEGPDGWVLPSRDEPLELSDAPPRAVAKVLLAVAVGLLVSMALVALLMTVIEEHAPIGAAAAEAQFRTAAPPLLPDPKRALHQVRQANALSDDETIDHAMRTVVSRGWGEAEPAPGRAEIAIEHAEAVR